MRVLDASAFDGCVPKGLDGCTAENADEKLQVWSVVSSFERNSECVTYRNNHPCYVKCCDYLQRTSRIRDSKDTPVKRQKGQFTKGKSKRIDDCQAV